MNRKIYKTPQKIALVLALRKPGHNNLIINNFYLLHEIFNVENLWLINFVKDNIFTSYNAFFKLHIFKVEIYFVIILNFSYDDNVTKNEYPF